MNLLIHTHMFSGIVEAKSHIIKSQKIVQAERIWIERPAEFNDLKIGDSLCTNGVCLTIEDFNQETLQLCLGYETLTLLHKSLPMWKSRSLNLERSLKFGDRVHGHLVTGHVDEAVQVLKSEPLGDVWLLEVSKGSQKFFWKKGSAAINGVSLTINQVDDNSLSFCLIPETLQKTNLNDYKVGDFLNLECDYLAKAYLNLKSQEANSAN